MTLSERQRVFAMAGIAALLATPCLASPKLLAYCGLLLPAPSRGWQVAAGSQESADSCHVSYERKRRGKSEPDLLEFSREDRALSIGPFSRSGKDWQVDGAYPRLAVRLARLPDRTIWVGEYLYRANCGSEQQPQMCTADGFAALIEFDQGPKVAVLATDMPTQAAMMQIARKVQWLHPN